MTTSLYRFLAPIAVCVAWLSGCATPAPLVVAPDMRWSAEGRVSIQSVIEGQNRIDTARFAWTERPQTSELALYSPFGDTLAQVRVEPERAVLRLPDKIATAASVDALVARELGIELPVSGLRYWLRGEDTQGRRRAPESFEEDGWRVAYSQMDEAIPSLPKTLRLERAQPAPVSVRVAVERWMGIDK
ncbi:MAG TPA: outer membrane lipoprotein LolB [Burkholderiaceae bacterium]|nr:outer membrane lipoprotein LolB [Burkholderiaceae bacterium]